MAKAHPPLVQKTLGLLLPLGPVKARAMFGGWGFSCEEVNIAFIAWDRLYFRVDAESKPRFIKAGGEPFLYEAKSGKTVEMPYCTPPKAALNSSAKILPWAELALAAAKRARKTKPAPKKIKPQRDPWD